MNKNFSPIAALVLAAISFFPIGTSAQELKPIQLLKPQTEGGRPLMLVLKERKTSRTFSPEKLPQQMLSNLLWAAFGVNRPDSGRRTAPSALNWQEIDVYAATSDGLFLYDAKDHQLKPVLSKDLRALTGRQTYVQEAPVNLIFVADYSRMGQTTDEQKEFYGAADTGSIVQNVYLFCASEGLATGVRALIDRPALAKEMNLRSDQRIILAQSVGYPKK
ncbi:MAG TPA: nitroreductase family protein [Thermodesulfobacteriota bacterium]|nr:nitroreductase family protein [Thermodesulfobacteriota bacterium]